MSAPRRSIFPLGEQCPPLLGHEHANSVGTDVDDANRHIDIVTTPHDDRPNAIEQAVSLARAVA